MPDTSFMVRVSGVAELVPELSGKDNALSCPSKTHSGRLHDVHILEKNYRFVIDTSNNTLDRVWTNFTTSNKPDACRNLS